MPKLHHKSKRYEIQKYMPISMAYVPIGHTNDKEGALEVAENKPYIQVVDRKTRIIIKQGKHDK